MHFLESRVLENNGRIICKCWVTDDEIEWLIRVDEECTKGAD